MLLEPLGDGVSIELIASSLWQRWMTSTEGFKVGEKDTKVEEQDRHRQQSRSVIDLHPGTRAAEDGQVAQAKGVT